jgi:hypothetical protein
MGTTSSGNPDEVLEMPGPSVDTTPNQILAEQLAKDVHV